MRSFRPILLLLLSLTLAACGSDDAPPPQTSGDDTALPQPQTPAGAVTGMPSQPGPGEVPLGGEPPPPPPLFPADGNFGMPPLEDNPETGLIESDASSAETAQTTEPSVADAVAVIEGYYAAIAAGDYARAYAAWSDGGRSSGQTPEQFAAGFADTAAVGVKTGEPGPLDAAAGSRYVEIPVSVTATQRDGSRRDYVGHYTLRRAVVDGASAEQRAWRIASAELRELRR